MRQSFKSLATDLARGAACALALATPLAAQDADPMGQLAEGYIACLSGGSDVDTVLEILAGQGWSSNTDGEDGLIYLTPGAGEDTFAYLADDGSFCHVESLRIDSATASEILAATLEQAGYTDIDYNKDEMGCTQLGLGDGLSATITSGGNDPICGSETDSGVRFATE